MIDTPGSQGRTRALALATSVIRTVLVVRFSNFSGGRCFIQPVPESKELVNHDADAQEHQHNHDCGAH
jgi:hypothetical protein